MRSITTIGYEDATVKRFLATLQDAQVELLVDVRALASSRRPGFAKTARDEGFEAVAEWFETLARAEKSHAGRFTQVLESVS